MEYDTQMASRVLPQAGDKLCRTAPQGRVERAALISHGCRDEVKKVCNTKKASKCGAEGKKRGRQTRRDEKFRTIDSLRKYVESVRRGDGHMRGSAKELGVTYPNPSCSCSPTGAHYYIEIAMKLFRCKYCWTVIWQPYTMYEAKGFVDSIYKYGLQAAYQYRVSARRKTVEALVMLNALMLVKEDMKDAGDVSDVIVEKYNKAPDDEEQLVDIVGCKKSLTVGGRNDKKASNRYTSW